MKNFNPCRDLTTDDRVEWIKAGDIEAAKALAFSLAMFLDSVVNNEEVKLSLRRSGIHWIGSGQAKLIIERLRDDPKINKEAQIEFMELIKAGHKNGSAKLTETIEKLRVQPGATKGKSLKSGVELFAKFLVPNKTTKHQFEAIWLASFVADNQGNSKSSYEKLANSLNALIEANNQIINDFRSKKRDDLAGYLPALPRRCITKDQLERAYREHKATIQKKNDLANGVTRNLIKKK